jgi:hypothetical protein
MWIWLHWKRNRHSGTRRGGAPEAAKVAQAQLRDAQKQRSRADELTQIGEQAIRRTTEFTAAVERALRGHA